MPRAQALDCLGETGSLSGHIGQGGANGIYLLAAQRLRIESCIISNMGVNGVMYSVNATELIVIDTIVRDNGGSGIGGDSNRVTREPAETATLARTR